MRCPVYLDVFPVFISFATVFITEVCGEYFLPSELEICDGKHLRIFKKQLCPGNKLVFSNSTTKVNSDCVCISGIWVLINRDCIPTVLPGKKGGCILTPQIKAMHYLGALGIAEDFFSVITTSKHDFKYKVLRPIQTASVHGFVWLYSGDIFKSSKQSNTYCATHRSSRLRKKIMSRYVLHGKLTMQYECSEAYKTLVSPQVEYEAVNPQTSECTLNCNEAPKSKLVKRSPNTTSKREKKTFISNLNFQFKSSSFLKGYKKKLIVRANRTSSISKVNKTQDELKKRQAKHIKDLVRTFHSQALQTVLSITFDKNFPFGRSKPGGMKFNFVDSTDTMIEHRHPIATFQIMERLQDIVHKSCPGAVPKHFLLLAHIIFKAIYQVKGSVLMEKLKEKEAEKILQFLTDCHLAVKPIYFNSDCSINDLEKVSNSNKTLRYNRQRHLALEIPWKIIDLSVGTCINAFGPSYIMYHKMEQALEKLFTKDLRILWKRPPENEVFYTRLYGPHWKYNLERLDDCVEQVYARNTKVYRLRRPDEINRRVQGRSLNLNDPKEFHQEHFKIPQLTPPKYQSKSAKKGRMVLRSAKLMCQSFNLQECYEQNPYSW